ncbi:MAG: U32 family peptidase [FCB group bacterium]|nr:U32 family peptidase [FCB group bacterium]
MRISPGKKRNKAIGTRNIELLAPAKDLECGRAAIDCGADALYVGADRYGAREAAGNSVEDIAALVEHAHRYWARVYVAINTLLFDDELEDAVQLIGELYAAGVDGIIIQDTGLLECALPPIPLIASTQMHNHTPEKVAFLDKVGLRRVILARELSLEEIRAIREAAPEVELECFVHGALCVSYSGQCYLSYALGGRSANRGQCAQPCRKTYSLVDAKGREIEAQRHLLSLKDMNLSPYLGEMLDAGVTSFKIEGRLKDITYVANVVAHYRAKLDEAMAERGLRRSSSGRSEPGFTPNPVKTFNRGYTDYFLHGRKDHIGSPDTPKMIGEAVGRVVRAEGNRITLNTTIELHPGDGLCYFDREGRLDGTVVNGVDGRTIVPEKPEGLRVGTIVFRNHDHEYLEQVRKSRHERHIGLALRALLTTDGLLLTGTDEDGVTAEAVLPGPFDPARDADRALENLRKQLSKTGDSAFEVTALEIDVEPAPFVPLSALNGLRRDLLEKLGAAREAKRPRETVSIIPDETPYPEDQLTYLGNVLNARAKAFYRRHGVEAIEPGAEAGGNLRDRKVMTTRYCLKHQMNLCPRYGGHSDYEEPLALVDDKGHRVELRFNCKRCEMEIYFAH